MSESKTPELNLKTETLRQLSGGDLDAAQGGAGPGSGPEVDAPVWNANNARQTLSGPERDAPIWNVNNARRTLSGPERA
jgi:hypothetical protein